jgi:glutamate-1-semialdehyde 2,1-aminomutase
MEHIAPQGPVYQAGTLSGNPVAMAAGLATLKQIKQEGFYDALDEKAAHLAGGLEKAVEKTAIAASIDRVGSMLGLFFTDRKVNNFEDAKTSNLDRFTSYYQGMLKKGIYLAPSQFEALFVSSAHNLDYLEETIHAAEEVLLSMAEGE